MSTTYHVAPLLVLALATAAHGQDGSVDLSFGVDGLFHQDWGSYGSGANDMAIQPDGKIVMAGYDSGDEGYYAVARCLPNGTLDPSFSFDGLIRTSIRGGYSWGEHLALLPDGRIAVSGLCDTLPSDEDGFITGAVVMYAADGALDVDFGANGMLIATVAGGSVRIGEMLATDDGGLLLAGTSAQGVTMMKLTGDGDPDNSFSFDGIALTSIEGLYAEVRSMLVQDDGRILVIGSAGSYSSDTTFVVRYAQNGSLDPTFGNGGVVLHVSNHPNTQMNGAVLLGDGRILLCGVLQEDSEYRPSIVMLAADGVPDASIGPNGIRMLDLAIDRGQADAAILLPNGKIALAGRADTDDGSYAAVFRLTPEFDVDPTFGNSGWSGVEATGIESGIDQHHFYALAMQADGNIMAAGYAGFDGENIMISARFMNDNGTGLGTVTSDPHRPLILSPNPVTDRAYISFALEKSERCSLHLFDATGALVQTILMDQWLPPGIHQRSIDLRTLSTGTYVLSLVTTYNTRTISLIKQP